MSEESRRITYGDGREALLAAVVEVVAEKGLRGVTYRAVAARAGVNHTLVTHHFGSIEGLLLATMEWAVRRSISETQLEYVADVDGRFADALMSAVSSEPELQLFHSRCFWRPVDSLKFTRYSGTPLSQLCGGGGIRSSATRTSC